MNRVLNYALEPVRAGWRLGQRLSFKGGLRPVHGYLGWTGHGNTGDESCLLGLKRLRPDLVVLPAVLSRRAVALGTRLGLDGPRFFQTVVLGGGTLIRRGQFRECVAELLRLGQRLWSCGTGVGSAGWSQTVAPDLGDWRSLLDQFEGVAVRGPKSKEHLEALGVDRVEVCGDLALALAREEVRAPADPPILAVNVSVPIRANERVAVKPMLDVLAQVSRRWQDRGGLILPLALDRADIPPLTHLCRTMGVTPRGILFTLDPERVLDALAPCTALIGVRLHSAVLATCVGVPPILFGYREKCLDFMLSMGLQETHIDLANIDARVIEERIEAYLQSPPVPREEILTQARRWARVQAEYVQRIIGPRAPCESHETDGTSPPRQPQ